MNKIKPTLLQRQNYYKHFNRHQQMKHHMVIYPAQILI
jgi:hypothetical protein